MQESLNAYALFFVAVVDRVFTKCEHALRCVAVSDMHAHFWILCDRFTGIKKPFAKSKGSPQVITGNIDPNALKIVENFLGKRKGTGPITASVTSTEATSSAETAVVSKRPDFFSNLLGIVANIKSQRCIN